MVDCAITNARVVTPAGIIPGGVAIAGEKIVAVALDSALPPADMVIDAKGQFLIPGVIDTHVHLGLIMPFEDDCRTETTSAAAGGVTTVMTYLMDHSSYAPLIANAREKVEKNAIVDVAFHAAVMNRQHLAELETYVQMGVRSFKLFMAYRGKEGERLNITAADDGFLYVAFEAIQSIGAIAMVHAENVEIFFELYHRFKERHDLAAWTEARPDFCEAENIKRAAYLAELTGVTLHVVHVSSGIGADAVKEGKQRGVRIVGETCPQYLTLTCDGANILNPLWAKITPPIRTKDDNYKLWESLRQGWIETMGTDHVSNLEKNKLGDNVWQTRPGFPGLGTYLPLMLSEGVNKGRISMERLVEICCYNNAKAYGLYPRKGTISPGADADLVLVDLDLEREVVPSQLYSATDFTPWTGWRLKGWPTLTMVRGGIVMRDGEITAMPGTGKTLRCGVVNS
jgi:dihydroorotase (multifunctional complex type)